MWLSRYFVMPAVQADSVGEEFADGQTLNPDDTHAHPFASVPADGGFLGSCFFRAYG